MSEFLANLYLTFYSCNMRNRNSYHIPREFLKAHKKAIKALVGDRRFDILRMRCEKEMNYKEIAEIYDISSSRINQIIAQCCYLIEKAGYQITQQ